MIGRNVCYISGNHTRILIFIFGKKNQGESKKENKSITTIVEAAFLQYFKDELPGLCKSCRYLNEPTERFCSRCGKPLVEKAWEDYFKNFEEFWWKEEHFERIEKIIIDHSKKKRLLEKSDSFYQH